MVVNPNSVTLVITVFAFFSFNGLKGQGLESVDLDNLPKFLDSDDIAYFFERSEVSQLHSLLQTVFDRSARNPEVANYIDLPDSIAARGGGFTYTSEYKLKHDLEQAEYLASILTGEEAEFFASIVAPMYRQLLDRIPQVAELNRTQGLYPFSKHDRATTRLELLYNKALHLTNVDTPESDKKDSFSIINASLQPTDVEHEWYHGANPGIIVVDNILTPEALQAVQKVMYESTVWYQTKLPLKFGGYVGAYIDDGLHDPILLKLAEELTVKLLPNVLKDHPLRYLWAYKYDSEYSGINLHADQAAVNVNLWLTPDKANLDPTSGGLVVFKAKPPPDWDFEQYNTDTEFVRQSLLQPTGFSNVTVPYRLNRAVIFDSALFHQTDSFKFRKGYLNRRINLTLLFGNMRRQGDMTDEL